MRDMPLPPQRTPSVIDTRRAQPRRWRLTWTLFAVFTAFLAWRVIQGHAPIGASLGMIAFWALLLVVEAWLDRRWNAPAKPATDTERVEPAPITDRRGESFGFPLALAATILGTLALLGFPGGGAGTGLAILGVLAISGWLALRRAIDGP